MPKKNDALLWAILVSAVFCWVYFSPQMLSLLIGPEPWFAKFSVVVFVLSLDLLWLAGMYHCWHIVFAIRSALPRPVVSSAFTPPVAILYVTCNDFNAAALESCLRQEYPDAHTFICDDSDDPVPQRAIDEYAASCPQRVSVIRRGSRCGFKAGNINHAIQRIDRRFTHLCVSDSDTMLPPDFLKQTLRYFQGSRPPAFVQTVQRSLEQQPGWLGRCLKYMVDIHWRYYMPLKNRYGFVMWYGHGAVLRRDVIEQVGGIPEVATEDLAFSSEARRHGHYGIVTDAVSCAEEFPRSLERFRKRNRKWIAGTAQYLLRYYPRLLRARDVSWVEKADVLISAVALLQALPFIALICATAFIMPFYYARYQMQGPLFLIAPAFYAGPVQALLKIRYNVFWMLDFYVVMFLTIFLPLLPAVTMLWHNKRVLVRYVCVASFVHLAVLLDSVIELARYTVTGKAWFPVTNSTREPEITGVRAAEVISGLVLSVIAWLTHNLWLISLAAALTVGPLLRGVEPNRWIRRWTAVPFCLTVLIMSCILVTILQYR